MATTTLGMTSRMYYQEKDHIDIVYKNKYHNAIILPQETWPYTECSWEKYPKDIHSEFRVGLPLYNMGLCNYMFIKNSQTFDFSYHPSFNVNPHSKTIRLGERNGKGYYVSNFSNTIHEVPNCNEIFSGKRDVNLSKWYNDYDSTHPDDYLKNIRISSKKLNLSNDSVSIINTVSLPSSYIYFRDQYNVTDCFLVSTEGTSWWLGVGDVQCYDYTGNAIGPVFRPYTEGADPQHLFVLDATYIPETEEWFIQCGARRTLDSNERVFLYRCNRTLTSVQRVMSQLDVTRKYFLNILYNNGYYYYEKATNNRTLYDNFDLWRTSDFASEEWITENFPRNAYTNPNWKGRPYLNIENVPCITIDDEGEIVDGEYPFYHNYSIDISFIFDELEYILYRNSGDIIVANQLVTTSGSGYWGVLYLTDFFTSNGEPSSSNDFLFYKEAY